MTLDQNEIETQIKAILSESLNAPSGDNVQPWSFSISGNKVTLYNNPERDLSLYNFDQIASYISEGALVENIAIVATKYGYKTNLELFTNSTNSENMVGYISFFKEDLEQDKLYPYISSRITNRKPYKDIPLEKEIIDEINIINQSSIKIISEKNDISLLAEAASRNEFLVLNNYGLHKFLFDHIKWTQESADRDREGFFVKTFEMNALQRFIFKLASSWGRMKILQKLGLASKVASENKKTYQQSASFISFVVSDVNKFSSFQVGRDLQRLWLTLTSFGVSLHPLTGIVFLKNKIDNSDSLDLSNTEKDIINQAYSEISRIFKIESHEKIIFLARVGFADPPSAASPKKPLDQFIVSNVS